MERNGMEWSAAEKDTWNEWNDFIPFRSIPLIPPSGRNASPCLYPPLEAVFVFIFLSSVIQVYFLEKKD